MDPSRATPLVASASAPDPQALMAAYPFASSTPSAHVSRHLSTLSSVSSVPSFVMHGQQQYQMDPNARQYAARALEMEAQQGTYQGYAPPARWSQSEYTAPVDTYYQYSGGGNSSHSHSAQAQQYGYQQGAQVSDHRAQTQASQYQYSSSQPSQQYSQSHAYPSEGRPLPQSTLDQSASHPRSNLKPQSQSYSQQQYPSHSSSLNTSTSDPTGLTRNSGRTQYQNYPGAQQRQRQASYSTGDPTTYSDNAAHTSQQNTASSYNSQAPTSSSYSQPQSSATSYPSQPNSGAAPHSRSAQPESIASAFLAPLASHQFAPRLSQPVSTFPSQGSDNRRADGRSAYAGESHAAYSGGQYPYSMDAQAYPSGTRKQDYSSSQVSSVEPPYPSQHLQRSASLSQKPPSSRQDASAGQGYTQVPNASYAVREQYSTGYSTQPQPGPQGYQDHGHYGRSQDGYSGQALNRQQSRAASGYYEQTASGHQKQDQAREVRQRAGQRSFSASHQQQQQPYAQYSPQERQAQINTAQSGQVAQASHSNQTVHPHAGQNVGYTQSVHHSNPALRGQGQRAQYTQHAGAHSQPQRQTSAQYGQPLSQNQISSREEQVHQHPYSSQSLTAQNGAYPGSQSGAGLPQSQHRYPEYLQSQAQAQLQAQSYVAPASQHPLQATPVQQAAAVEPHPVAAQPQHPTHEQSHSPQVQTQQVLEPQAHAQSQSPQMPQSQPTHAPSDAQPPPPRDVYAPLAGRPLRGRGLGRPLYHGPPRVLQGGPQRVLTPPQPQAQPTPRFVHGAPVRRPQNIPSQQAMGMPRAVQQPPRQVQQGQASATPQQVGTATSLPESGGDTSMEYVGPVSQPQPSHPSSTSEYRAIIQETNAIHPETPPPPYEPLMKDRSKPAQSAAVPEQVQGQGQEVNGYAAQLQQLSIRSQQSTPQPHATLDVQQQAQAPQTIPQQHVPPHLRNLQREAPPPPKHTAQDSAAHFEAFLSAGASTTTTKQKPEATTQANKTAVQRPAPPPNTSSSSSTSSARPRLSPVVELQRSAFVTPRKDKKWREPIRDASTDTPKRLDVSSPDSVSLSPMKRKRDPDAEMGPKTVKRMMSMSIENARTPSTLSRTYDATMRTPGSGSGSRMKMVVEVPLRKPAEKSLEQMRAGPSTGKRDPHLEKLCALIDDIIEAEDGLDPEAAAENGGPTDWFSAKTTDWSAPLLAPSVIGRLTQLAGRRGTRLSGVDSGNLTRILKTLGRSVAKGEDMDPFGSFAGGTGPGVVSKAKSKGKKKGKGSTEEEPDVEETKEETELGEEDFEKLTRTLEMGKEAVVAADCILAFLSAEKLPKQLYSEDLITSCLSVIKTQLSSIIYPYVETASDVHGHSPALLLHVAQSNSTSAIEHRNLLGEIFRILNGVLPRITALASHGISETMVIQAVFIGIGPFFVVEVTSEKGTKSSAADKKNGRVQVLDALGGSTSMRGLRLAALGLVRALFAGYESQRAWIVEEILGSLIKLPDMKLKAGQFKLRDGATIHVVSALLFQLVQTSAHDVRIHAQRLARKRREAIADAKVASFVEGGKTPLLDEHDREEIHLYLNGLESATKTAKTIVLFLTQRSGKNKNTKSTNEAEYRAIFDNLIQDILVVLNWPEWPAANLLMSIVCKYMLSSLDDVKSSSDTAAKSMALDHLGEIATRFRETHLTMQLPFETTVKPLEEIVSSCDLKALDDLILGHSDVYAHLTKRSSDDQAYDSARELTAATWAQELASCLRQCDSILSKTEDDDEMDGSVDANLPQLASKIKNALRNVWNEGTNDMFDLGTDAEIKRVDDLAERFGGTQSLRNAFEPILAAIILALDAPAVFMRTKALRALGLIVTKDPSILKQANVRRAIESHLMDSSPAVRDAAVELIGKYLVLSPELVDDYYPQIANRIADTGLAVRKRVIKLLKSLYALTDNHQRRVDICTKLVLRLLDEDDGIKDLAINSIEELWFSDLNEPNANRRGATREHGVAGTGYMTSKISVIMGVNANFRDRHSPLEDMLHEIIVRKGDKDSGPIVQRYVDVCDALTDSLVDAQEIPGFSVVNCIRTVHVFTAAHPTVMSTRKAVVLLPYLKSGSTADDHTIADYLLKIFRSCIPRMPTGTSKFGTELQQTLEPMVIKPSGTAGVSALPETVACLCAVVHHITHDYQRLVALLRSCNTRLVQILNKSQTTPQDLATLSILALIVSLLGEHSDFDKIRENQPALKASIDSIKEGSIAEYIYGLIHKLYQRFSDPQLRGRLLQCFGFLFRAHPTLLTHDDSAEMMDAIFASPQEEAQARLLKIMQDFLLSEASKHTHAASNNKPKKGGAVDMEELIGNTDGFADSGVSSAIIQRYLTQILSSALSPNRHIQAPAVDILSFTVRQGLAHPLQCFPIIVALETSHDNSLSSRASNLHTLLHNKHASLLNSRYVESVGKSLEYQKQLQPGSWKGYRLSPHPTALLHRWYSLVREKRQPKLDFLKSFLRVFDVDVAVLACSQDHLDLVRYIAENMSAFDYKAQEEILTVIRHLTHVLSVAGMHIVEILHQERRQREESGVAMEIDGPPADGSADGLARARVVTVISIILVLKAHLKHLYGITEEKASRFVPGKKTAAGDKPATARHDKPISWDRLTFATRVGKTANDILAQEEQLLELWAEDGVTAEPDDFGE